MTVVDHGLVLSFGCRQEEKCPWSLLSKKGEILACLKWQLTSTHFIFSKYLLANPKHVPCFLFRVAVYWGIGVSFELISESLILNLFEQLHKMLNDDIFESLLK